MNTSPSVRAELSVNQLPVVLLALLLGGGSTITHAQSGAGELRAIDASEATGSSAAVVVGRTALAHTSLILPVDDRGKLVGIDHPTIQTERVLDNLSLALAEARTDLGRVVKVNVYVTSPDIVRDVQKVFSRKFTGPVKPAVTFVEGNLPLTGAYIALDAVAATRLGLGDSKVQFFNSSKLPGAQSSSHVAIMPDGVKVYVSGQAARGPIREATSQTMSGLFSTLESVGLNRSHVVQVKAFLTPIQSVSEVEAEIAKAFEGGRTPPVVFAEWTSTTPIEIELIAFGGTGGERAREPLEFITPAGMTASPVYTRVTRINFGKTIYLSGLHGIEGSADAQLEDIFATLKFLLGQAGSDLRHLAKATYYVANEQASARLNDLRPKFFEPTRPPAASKAAVRGVAQAGRTITLDMIAVTKP